MLKWDDLSRQWAQGKWGRVYLFAGQEDFLIEQALRALTAHWLKNDDSGLNSDRYDAEKDDVGLIIQALQTLPFLADTRVVRIDHACDFAAEESRRLSETLTHLSPESRIVLIWGREWKSKDSASPLIKGIAAAGGEIVVFWPLFPDAAHRWILQRTTLYQKEMEIDAATWLLHEAGEGLRQLDQEIQKCVAYVGGRPTIELHDVQTCFGYARTASPYVWIDALRQKRSDIALQVMQELLEHGEEPIALMALLSRSLRNWLSAKHPRETTSSLSMRFFLRRGQEGAFIQELKGWSVDELAEGIRLCVEADQQVKTGKETPAMALTDLCLRLSATQTRYLLR